MENLFQIFHALQNVNKNEIGLEDVEGSVSAPAASSLHFTKRGLASAAGSFTSRMESDEEAEAEANADKYIEISRLRPRSHIIDMSGSQLRKMTLNPVRN